MKEALQPIAGSVVHEILVKGPIDKAQGGRVIERVSGNVDTGDLERRPFRPPGSEERGVRLPVAPAILRLPLPLAVPGVDLAIETSWRNNAPMTPYPQAKSSSLRLCPAPRTAQSGAWIASNAAANATGIR